MLVYVIDSPIRPVGGIFWVVRALVKAVCRKRVLRWRSVRAKRVKIFHLRFSVVWIASRSTFVFCTALLTAEYAEGDRAQLEGQQRTQALYE